MKLFNIPIPFTRHEAPADHQYVLAWRRSFSSHTFKGGFWLGEGGEYLSKSEGKWRHGYGFHTLTIRFDPRSWEWSRTHDYYDGPLDSLWLGPIQFSWQGDHCEKCMPSD